MKSSISQRADREVPMRSHRIERRVERIGDLTLTDVTYPPWLRLATHAHPLAALSVTLDGGSEEIFGARRHMRQPGTVLFRPRRIEHADAVGPRGARCFVIELPHTWTEPLGSLTVSSAHGGSLASLGARAHLEWLRRDDGFELMVQGIACEMAAALVRTALRRKPLPTWLAIVKTAIDDTCHRPVTLAELAAIGGVHPVHLARAFRRHFGLSIGAYVRRRRVDRAALELVQTRKSIAEIALGAGFSSHSRLSTTFKRVVGVTPADFRRSRR